MKKIISTSKTAASSKKSAKESSTTSRQSASPKGSAKKTATSKPSSGSSAKSSARSSAKSSTASKKKPSTSTTGKPEIVIYCPVPKSGNAPALALHIAVSVASGVPLFASPKKRVVRHANVKRNGNAE